MLQYGIKKYIPAGSETSKAIKMANNYVKTNTDETGKVVDPTVYDNAIQSFLSPYSDDLRVKSKILSLKNQKKALTSKLESREKSVAMFKSGAQERIFATLKKTYKDPFDAVNSLASTNMALLSAFKDQIYNTAVERNELTATIQNEYNRLHNQTSLLSGLTNARTFGASYNPDAYGWFMKTNPNNGAIVNMEFREATDLKEGDFIKTDSVYGEVPIYLYSYGPSGKKESMLAGVPFREKGDGTLGSSGLMQKAGQFFSRAWAQLIPGGDNWKSKLEKQKEFPMGMTSFDGFAIPKESVVKDGLGNYYWFDGQSKLNKANSAADLKGFLSSMGRNPEDVDNHFYNALPEFVKQFWQADDKGEKPALEVEHPVLAPSTTPPRSLGPKFEPWSPRGGTKTTSPPAVQSPSPEFTQQTGYQSRKVIQKGESIFKPWNINR